MALQAGRHAPMSLADPRSAAPAILSTSILESIVLGVLGSLVTIVVVVAAGYGWFYLSKRARLVWFFHLGKNRAITLYTSSLNVVQGGSHGLDGILRSYRGPAIPTSSESGVVADFQRAFTSISPAQPADTGCLQHLRSILIAPSSRLRPTSLKCFEIGLFRRSAARLTTRRPSTLAGSSRRWVGSRTTMRSVT